MSDVNPRKPRRGSAWVWGCFLGVISIIGLLWQAPAQWWSVGLTEVSGSALTCERWSGSVWDARCEDLSWRDSVTGQRSDLGAVAIRVAGFNVPQLSLSVDLGWRRADSWLQGRLTWQFGLGDTPSFFASNVRLQAQLATLRASLPARLWRQLGAAGDAEGMLSGRLDSLSFAIESTPCAQGLLKLSDLRHRVWPTSLGPIELRLTGECPSTRGTIKDPRGTIKDLGGPVQVALQIYFEEPDLLRVKGQLIPRFIALDDWRPLLSFIGPVTADGGYGVDLTLEWTAPNP